jgi:hypothetical protein
MNERAGVYRRNHVIVVELSLLAALVSFCWMMARSSYFEAQPELIGNAIMVDLTFSAALCHWLLGIRLGGLAHWTTIPVLAAGLAIGRALLPSAIANTGAFTVVALALIETSALLLAIANIRKITRALREAKRAGIDRFDALEAALLALAPSAPGLVSYARFEVQIWTMALLGWFFAPRPPAGSGVFTHHKQPHWFALVGIFAFLVVVEGVLAHWLLHTYHFTTAKWIFAAMSCYAIVWLLGDVQALRVYRSSIRTLNGEPTLELRIGARGHAYIPVQNIASIELGTWQSPGPDEELFVLFGKPNVRLAFREPNAYKPAIGGEKRIRTLLTQIDDPERFKRELEQLSASACPP